MTIDPSKERREEFRELTALHPVWDKVPTWQQGVIRTQAKTIKDLRVERDNLRKGYLRKIAKLERRIAELTKLATPSTEEAALRAAAISWANDPNTPGYESAYDAELREAARSYAQSEKTKRP